jgi:hypothetical protein
MHSRINELERMFEGELRIFDCPPKEIRRFVAVITARGRGKFAIRKMAADPNRCRVYRLMEQEL